MKNKILLVDDDKDLADALAMALRKNDYEVSCTYSGAEARQWLRKDSPDVIVLDVMMETDTAGFELAYQIRDSKETSHFKHLSSVPIIILTAIDQVTNSRFSLNEKESFLPDINEFLTKPINIDELIEKIELCVQ